MLDRPLSSTASSTAMLTHPFSMDVIQVALPCLASWDAMSGDERSRFCSQCSKHVYNLSGMTRDEAEAFLREQTGEICLRFYRRADGTILTADCPVGIWDVRTRLARLWAGAVALAGFLTFGALSWGSRPTDPGEASDRFAQEGPSLKLQETLQQPQLIMGACPLPISRTGSQPAPPVSQP